MMHRSIGRVVAALFAAALFVLGASASSAQEAAVVNITVKNHRFEPAEPHAPANRPLVLRVRNMDAAPMEFESVTLRVEKVIAGNSEGTINVRALAPGRYGFFDDFHQSTRGTLIVQ